MEKQLVICVERLHNLHTSTSMYHPISGCSRTSRILGFVDVLVDDADCDLEHHQAVDLADEFHRSSLTAQIGDVNLDLMNAVQLILLYSL